MKRLLHIIIITPLLLSCIQGRPDLEQVKSVSFTENPFKEGLRIGYIELSEEEWARGDKEDAIKYAKKATILTNGVVPEMEVLYLRNLSITDLNNLLGAKYFIEAAFVNDIKKTMPQVAASAQVNFDCLVEILEEGEENYPGSLCKEKLFKARDIMASRLESIKKAQKEKRKMMEKRAIAQKEQEFAKKLAKQRAELRSKYRKMPEPSFIFFDFNKTGLDVTAQGILEKVAKDIKLFAPRKVIISGNADNVGSYSYNMQLALKRGNVVADHLIAKYGISPGLLDVKAYGKNNPRQEYDDTKKEIRNRYVEIKFLKDDRVYYIDK